MRSPVEDGLVLFFFNDGSKSINLTTCGYPESLRARVASLGFVSRDPRAAPARFPRADTSLVYPRESAPGAKPSRIIWLSFGYFVAESRNPQFGVSKRSSTWKTFAFSERSRKCIVARARPHFLRRRVRVSKAFTAALDHRPVPSDNVSTSRPLHDAQFPGIPKSRSLTLFLRFTPLRSPNEPEQSNHVQRAHLHRPDPRLSQDPRR